MSQIEFEKNDQEVIEMVNRSATPEAVLQAEQIADAITEPVPDEISDTDKEEQASAMVEEMERMYLRKKKMRYLLTVALCFVITAVLIILLYMPFLMVWVVNIGVLGCGMVAAVAVDRYVRRA